MRRIAIAIVQLFVFQLAGLSQSVAQSNGQITCPQSVQPVADETLKYQRHGDRCEGLFMQPVGASSHIRIIGYHAHPPVFPPNDSSRPISVSVKGAAPDSKFLLNAISTRFRQYYRMDAATKPSGTFSWQRNVMKSPEIDLTPRDLAIIACDTDPNVDRTNQRGVNAICDYSNLQLHPVSVGQDVTSAKGAGQIIFSSTVDISKLYIGLVPYTSSAPVPDSHLVENVEILEGSVLQALTPGIFRLRDLCQAGLKGFCKSDTYRITVTAIPRYANDTAATTKAIISVP